MGGYDLVMPFVSVQSKGGPHDDAAYAAGWAMGAFDARLADAKLAEEITEMVRAVDLRQAELVAMRHHCDFTHYPSEDPDWVQVTCVRARQDWTLGE